VRGNLGVAHEALGALFGEEAVLQHLQVDRARDDRQRAEQ